MSGLKAPPRFIPTLTEVVHSAPLPEAGEAVQADQAEAGTASSARSAPEDVVLRRVLQRLDTILEQRVHEAVATLVLAHTHMFAERLREEIAEVVQQCVSQAFAEETPHRSQDMKFGVNP